jgi:LPS sulfotransferase NodH
VADVLDFLDLGDVEAPAPPLARQRDEESLAWIDRYRRERARVA